MSAEPGPERDVPCPIGHAVDVIGDRWCLLIMRNAMTGTTRFDGFRAELGIADSVLTLRLARLVDAGLLTKTPYREVGRTRHEYRLTPAGADLLPVYNALVTWGTRHADGPDPDRRMRVLHTGCGTELDPGDHCPSCDRTVPRAEIAWARPWRRPLPFPIAEAVT